MAPSTLRLTAALVAVQVLFGAISVAGKLVLPYVDPFALAMCRLAAAALVLWALERVFVRSERPSWRELGHFAVFALFGVVLNQGLFLAGLSRSTATNAVLLIATIPVFTLLFAVLSRRERTRTWQLVGMALSFAGVVTLVARGLDLGVDNLVGNLMIVANAASYSFYLVISKPALERHDPLTVIAWVFIFGALEFVPIGVPALFQVAWTALPAAAWWAFVYIIIGATIMSYGLNNYVLRHAAASHVANYVYLQPVIGITLAIIVLKETFTPRVAFAAALILGGVALATRSYSSRRAGKPF